MILEMRSSHERRVPPHWQCPVATTSYLSALVASVILETIPVELIFSIMPLEFASPLDPLPFFACSAICFSLCMIKVLVLWLCWMNLAFFPVWPSSLFQASWINRLGCWFAQDLFSYFLLVWLSLPHSLFLVDFLVIDIEPVFGIDSIFSHYRT